MRAVLGDAVLADSSDIVEIEGRTYFPHNALERKFFVESERIEHCPWKGVAHFYDIQTADRRVDGGACYYPQPKEAAAAITDWVGFLAPVEVVT